MRIISSGPFILAGSMLLSAFVGKADEPVVAQVGDQKITLREYNNTLGSAAGTEGGERFNTPEGRKRLLDNMVRGRLIVAAARKAGVADRPDVQRRIATLKQELDDYFAMQCGEIIGGEYVKEKLAGADKEADAYYQKYKADFDAGTRVTVAQIQVASETAAKAAREQLRKGEDFKSLARQLSRDPATASKGGEMEPFGRAQCPLGRSFAEAAFALEKPGDLWPVVESPAGFHIIQLVGRTNAAPPTLEQTMYHIRAMLKMEKYDALVAAAAKEIPTTLHEETLSQASAVETNGVARAGLH